MLLQQILCRYGDMAAICKTQADRVRTGSAACRSVAACKLRRLAQADDAGSIDGGCLPSCSDGRGHRSDADDIENAAQIISKRCQTELAADIGEAPHQEGAL